MGVERASRFAPLSGSSPNKLLEKNPITQRRSHMGTGQGHHYAFAVADETAQLACRERLLTAGINVSPVMDRVYFKSIYTKDPDGHIVELATMGPGFLVDEPVSTTGTALQLPPWLERHRAEIAASLLSINHPTWPYNGSDAARGIRSYALPVTGTAQDAEMHE